MVACKNANITVDLLNSYFMGDDGSVAVKSFQGEIVTEGTFP